MELLSKYLETLQFTRVEDKQGYAIYGAGIAGMFGAGKQRYILLFVPSHLATTNQARASELPWQNLQTRNLHYSYRLKKQSWNPPQELPNPQFRVMERKDKNSTYLGPPDFPFEVLLLHDPKKKTKYQYNNNLSLYGVLESFNSVFNYIGEPLTRQNYQSTSDYHGNPNYHNPIQTCLMHRETCPN
jgi:hypothetical protein